MSVFMCLQVSTNLDELDEVSIMISCGDAQDFVPFGREYLEHHPGEVGLPPPRPSQVPPHIDLMRQLDTVSINSSKVCLPQEFGL